MENFFLLIVSIGDDEELTIMVIMWLYVSQTIMLYTLNLYSDLYQLFCLYRLEKRKLK